MAQGKNLPDKLLKPYDPNSTEDKIYKLWEESGFFNPDNLPGERKEPFTVIMPPPNANAPLHVGHALGLTIQDIMVRYARMRGKRALYLPGTDHAGFETQVVFEKKLEKEGTSRFKMDPEEFYKQVWDFVQTNKHISEEGIRRLGSSCDWSRNIFTLDERVVKIVLETFEQMKKDGLVYRGNRIANWCVKHQTSLSDLETKYEERTDNFYYFKYGPFTISTARPETKFGDKYVVMHPDDKRYADYQHGQKIELEWINGKVTATVIKDEAVDMEFGTGVMTITPAHDPIDFEIAQRHKLDIEEIIDNRGKLLPIAQEFSGLKIAEARPKIVEKLKEKGLLEKVDENYKHNVQLCYKCGTVIEPLLIPQWYVAMTKPLADGRPSLRDMAVNAVKDKEINIVPEHFEKTYMHWMENLRDWPISRQIAWGIKIPGETETFDTWFSSGQWPYVTLMAHSQKDFETYYPTAVMETGWDILFFWVARMIMFGYYKTGTPPFKTVFLHGLVRDKDRQKMSKSKGNVVDPLGVIQTYGTDALRFALIFSSAAGNDIPLAEDKIKGMKNFANKLWNITRFVTENGSSADEPIENELTKELDTLLADITSDMDNFRFHLAAEKIYHYVWHRFADEIIEESKKDEKIKPLLMPIWEKCLKALHPFMPFVTEEIWQTLGKEKLLMIEPWPLD
jgi:valyl-tRNA synthetase